MKIKINRWLGERGLKNVADNKTVAEIVKQVRRECNSLPLPNAAGEKLKLVREINDAHRREIAEKDAEIEKLKFDIMHLKSVQRTSGEVIIEQTNKVEAKDAKIAELERRLKVAEGDPCNARDGEGSSLRIGWEGEKEYCVVAKYRQDLQVELEDYDYHRVTGPLPLDIAKHWLAYHERIRTRSEDPKILVREVSKWRIFDKVEEGGVN